jgi:predicted dehydrogenase
VNDDLADIAADVVIEGTGDPSAIADALAAARNGATIVLLGSPRGRSSIFIGDLQTCGLRLVGAHISALSAEARRTGDNLLQELATAFLDALAAGKLEVADLVGDPIDPREVGLIYRQLSDGLLERAYLDWSRIPTNERLCRRNVLQWPVLPPKGGSIRASPVQTVATPARPLRFAIFGCGDIGPANAKAVARANNAELVFVHDPVPALAEAVAAQHGGVVALAPEQAFDKECVDAVLLSVPHDVHAPLITKAAAAGLHVMVEKPLAVDLPTATAAVEACKAAGVTLSVCFPYRYEPAPAAALDLVKGGALGAFRGAAVTFHADKPQSYWHGGFSNRAFSNWRAKAPRAGGGVMIMNLTHYVDMLMHLTGCEAVEVSAVANVLPGQEVEDGIAVSVRFENGAVGTFLGSASTRGAPSSRMELWGEHGTLQLEPEPCIYTERAVPGLLTGRWNALPKDHVDVRRVLVERFASAVLDQREPDVTAGDGLAVQAFVDAVYRSMRSGRPEAVARVRVPR